MILWSALLKKRAKECWDKLRVQHTKMHERIEIMSTFQSVIAGEVAADVGRKSAFAAGGEQAQAAEARPEVAAAGCQTDPVEPEVVIKEVFVDNNGNMTDA